MARRKRTGPAVGELVGALEGRLQPPFGVVLGSPREAAEVAAALQGRPTAANGVSRAFQAGVWTNSTTIHP